MPQPTVSQLLDQLAGGTMTVDQVAEHIRNRKWPPRRQPTEGEAWGVTDSEPPGDDEWGTVESDSRLTPDQYRALAVAYSDAVNR